MALTDYARIYATLHCQLGMNDTNNIMNNDVITTILTQYHVSKGVKVFGQDGIDAVLIELQQLHDRMVMDPTNPTELSTDEKKAALQYLMFLKRKRCGRIKGRGCADGRKQRSNTNKDDVSAPTVATESLLLTCLIDAMEERDVATVDIPGAFMQADMEGDDVHMKLEGKMVHLLAQIDPKLYRKYITDEKGKLEMYVKLKKALYDTLQAAMLFWKNLSTSLKEWGFTIYPYNWCVATM